jgi:predicted transcriptional regulator
MAKKRDKLDVTLDMLASIQKKGGEIKPTHLMYMANLSHTQMMSYLEELVRKNLVSRIKRKNYDYLIITDKGCELVQKIKEMKEFEKTFGL